VQLYPEEERECVVYIRDGNKIFKGHWGKLKDVSNELSIRDELEGLRGCYSFLKRCDLKI
jgi:hypothetical protein